MNLTLLATFALLIGIAIAMALAVRAIGGNITLIDDWKKAWRWYSTYALLFISLLPDLFNGLAAGGYLDGTPIEREFSWALKLVTGGAFLLRIIKQLPKPKLPDWTPPAED